MVIKIRNISTENLDDLITVCIPEAKMNDPLILKGITAKRKWAHKILETYGSCAKVAYVGAAPVGMIQYVPNSDERIVTIQCIFVPDDQYNQKGIGSALLHALKEDMKTPKSYFDNSTPLALVAHAFDIPGLYPLHKFYQKRGFKAVHNDPYLVYYPIQKEYTYTKKAKFTPLEEDEGKALIFYDPSCPFCISFSEKIKEAIQEVTDIPIKIMNKAEDVQEVKKRGDVPTCAVNTKCIESFVTDKEKFQSEVLKALGQQ